jgi:adenylate cyclase
MSGDFAIVLSEAEVSLKNGDYLAAFERLLPWLEDGSATSQGVHLAILSLARSGASSHALRYLHAYAGKLSVTEDSLALEARILKDLFLKIPSPQNRSYGEAALLCYLKAFQETGGYYSGINAATLCFLLGKTDEAKIHACSVLELLDNAPPSYWKEASRAEAFLLLGQVKGAVGAITQALSYPEHNLSMRSITYHQLRRVCSAGGILTEILDELRPEPGVHFTGHLVDGIGKRPGMAPVDELALRGKVRELLNQKKVGFGYGALASGADIIIAEELLRCGAELHVVLPFRAEDFKAISVSPAGSEWEERFENALAQATSCTKVVDRPVADRNLLFRCATLLAMGLTHLRATTLGAPAFQLALWNRLPGDGLAGTSHDVQSWSSKGWESCIIDVPLPERIRDLELAFEPSLPIAVAGDPTISSESGWKLRSMIFADVKGFSVLSEEYLEVFLNAWTTRLLSLTERYQKHVSFINTWGDAVFAVLDNPLVTAHFSANLASSFLEPIPGVPQQLGIRVSAHAAPVFGHQDLLLGRENFYGMHVNKTARMEPCTPLNSVYVTEEFAALLALEEQSDFLCEYAGEHTLPKNFGKFRMYHLLPRHLLARYIEGSRSADTGSKGSS